MLLVVVALDLIGSGSEGVLNSFIFVLPFVANDYSYLTLAGRTSLLRVELTGLFVVRFRIQRFGC